jgi:hypothetical protein
MYSNQAVFFFLENVSRVLQDEQFNGNRCSSVVKYSVAEEILGGQQAVKEMVVCA